MMEYGYGVIFKNEIFKEDASVLLLDKALNMGNEELYHMYTAFCDNYGYSYDSMSTQEEFVVTFEDDHTGSGIGGLLAHVINDAEFKGDGYFVYEDGCLYVKAEIPWDDGEKQAMPTVKDIQRLLSVYLNPILTRPCSPCYVEVNN